MGKIIRWTCLIVGITVFVSTTGGMGYAQQFRVVGRENEGGSTTQNWFMAEVTWVSPGDCLHQESL
jgi:hypothetical protein